MPIAQPTMPPSESGVSMTRLSPNSSKRPWVTRNTPPTFPTSSPRITTRASLRISWRRPSLIALTMFICGMSRLPLALLAQVPRKAGVDVVEQRFAGRLRLALGRGDRHVELGAHARGVVALVLLGPELLALEVLPQARERVARSIDQRTRGGLDDRGPLPARRAQHRLTDRAVDGEE